MSLDREENNKLGMENVPKIEPNKTSSRTSWPTKKSSNRKPLNDNFRNKSVILILQEISHRNNHIRKARNV